MQPSQLKTLKNKFVICNPFSRERGWWGVVCMCVGANGCVCVCERVLKMSTIRRPVAISLLENANQLLLLLVCT